MRILIACEFSGTVRDAFIKRGHDAVSCDLLPTETPGPHIQDDCVAVICREVFDMIIMHPPCTKIALSGNGTYGRGKPRHQERLDAIIWTRDLYIIATNRCNRVAMENPKNVMGREIGDHTVIHPYQFGHKEQKETWLWLHGLPPLVPTHDVYDEMMALPREERERIFRLPPSKDRGHIRSVTYQGIANAMAEQWGGVT